MSVGLESYITVIVLTYPLSYQLLTLPHYEVMYVCWTSVIYHSNSVNKSFELLTADVNLKLPSLVLYKNKFLSFLLATARATKA
jgi:hypothetical protein